MPFLAAKQRSTTNRLAQEKSPYLLQHAHNPVDWMPWGDDAFATAKRLDKPIFLSIGYSTCHWCHVMEHESFEDPEIAKLLNDAFVCIKVDREERPDIDQAYMRVCQMMTGSGGWPLTIVMTPEANPFYAGTYIPKDERFGRVGLRALVPAIDAAWKTRRDEVLKSASQIRSKVMEPKRSDATVGPSLSTLERAARQLASSYDRRNGGFGAPPKFPSPHQFVFLLRYADRTGDRDAQDQALHTLRMMRRGGIFDHVGFGFHRYSVDAEWFIPHFEKMVYDQALLLDAYAEAFQVSGDPEFATTAREVVTYVLRDLLDAAGAFHSAEDADSEGIEGKFYLWTWNELERLVGTKGLARLAPVFGLAKEGNVPAEAHGLPPAVNHFHLVATERDELGADWDAIRERLLAERAGRIRPSKDDKILTDWNGLMIAALARAGRSLQEPAYTKAAERAFAFVWKTLRPGAGRLLHRFRDGEAAVDAFLDDYAFLAHAALGLFEATGNPSYLRQGHELVGEMNQKFWDQGEGGYFFTASEQPAPLGRSKDWHDGAIPSGNSVALSVLLRLSRMTGDTTHEERADRLVKAFPESLQRFPAAHTCALAGVDFALGATKELVLVGAAESRSLAALRAVADTTYAPRAVVVEKHEGEKELPRLAPFVAELTSARGHARAFLCQNFRCELPLEDPEELRRRLTTKA